MSEPIFDLSKAADMYEFCEYYEMGFNASKSWALKHFSMIERELRQTEIVLSVFMGIYKYVSPTKHGNNAAYAITTERIIVAQKNLIGEEIISVELTRVNDIKMKVGMMGGTVTFDAMTERFNIYCNKEIARRIYAHAQECIKYAKGLMRESKAQEPKSSNSFDDLKRLKELLDSGIITQEEFDAKKKQILEI